ncbi:serine/threonine protein kinase [Blumeria hordei DH14]|uniref:Serine/threonine-protein kinase ATG1 n=1 Tax=Blumeria graminis f. sp. hordei (strain DH14) TaxID=546991 RepID=N1J7K0_BLUG1|nr:serine/threonine protein kinase [Blumeria hordei DH14]
MDALSPRDVNAHLRVKQTKHLVLKQPAVNVKTNQKQKDHPPPPPAEVREPPSFDGKDGIIYKTGQMLGRGGFAICYEGQNLNTQQIYALKIVKSHMPQKRMEQKFQTELQIHSKMKHPNIVEFHRAFSYFKCTYIVLELCPNGSLMDMVKRRKYITEPEARYWTVQIAGAVKYMHGKGIIHRDLKMGNIFLDKNMDVKIGDFGLAALIMSGKDLQACRRTTLCGTPNYIAPEILSKEKGGHDHAVDIWSLGIIIFAMLTGKPPFQSETADEIYRRARERDYDWPSLDSSENLISKETKDLVSKLLQPAHLRPDPDQIVEHSFFMCGWTPRQEEMSISLREKHISPKKYFSEINFSANITTSNRNLKKLCVKCGVGPWTPAKKYISTYREVAEEEKLGLTPAVPLAEDVVYHPFHAWLQDQVQSLQEHGENPEAALKILEKILSPSSKSKYTGNPNSRAPVQSFAAQQRAKDSKQSVSQRQAQVNRIGGDKAFVGKPMPPVKTGMKISDAMVDIEERLVADMLQKLNFNAHEENRNKYNQLPSQHISKISIFDEREKAELVPNTRPSHILLRLCNLRNEIDRALKARSPTTEVKTPTKSPVIVVKWVDYTNKFGLGYILSNGSVGTLFRAMPTSQHGSRKESCPSTCVLIRDSEKHLINQSNPDWAHYGQLVPLSGCKVEFFENRGEEGLFSASVDSENFKATPGPNGEMFKLSASRDEFDSRKKERVALWRKFGNYMTHYGRDTEYPQEESHLNNSEQEHAIKNIVTFYQRWGDVGCWGFGDGHLQFNFPDHTKIILSSDGTWCDFYHLPLEAAHELSEKGIISAQALDERQHLSYPLRTMLNFKPKLTRSRSQRQAIIDPLVQEIPSANDFRRKIEFIFQCITEWTQNGGIGISDLTAKGRLRWSGARQTVNTKMPYKHVWVCVGGQATDERKVAWFDPRNPDVVLPDIEG